MQIITVAPIVRGAIQGTLTYFSKNPMEIGVLILVPVRNREVPALVLETKEVSEAKSTIKSSDYAIKKIVRHKTRRVWSNEFLKASQETANFSAQSLSEILLATTPKIILDAHLEDELKEPAQTYNLQTINYKLSQLAIQMPTNERIEEYRRLVLESFARHESVFICLPTKGDVLRVSDELKRGIEDYTFIFHSTLTKKRLLERWQVALRNKYAILVIGTPQYLSLPRYFKTIILDEEHTRSWKTLVRPLIDMRILAENYARNMGSTIIFGAPILRPETHKRIKENEIKKFVRIQSHTKKDMATEVLDPRIEEKEIKERTGRRTIQILGEKIRSLIERAQEKKENVVLLSARKGLSPITACGDCGTLVRCKMCDTPLVIHRAIDRDGASRQNDLRDTIPQNRKETRGQGTRIFSCHSCGFTRIPEDGTHESCSNCGGFRLDALGIGIERIEEEVTKLFPHVLQFVFDGERVKTRPQAHKLVAQFEKSEGVILIATPMVIPYLTEVQHSAIISIDSLFAIPDFRMNERIFTLILALREKTSQTLLVQTRTDDTTLLKQALLGDLSTFTEQELAARKALSYPPYGTIIKITLHGKKTEIPEEMARLKNFLVEYSPITPNTISRISSKIFKIKTKAGVTQNIFRIYMILKLKEDAWPNETLLAKLRALPHQFTIEVNPDNLL